jgi:hypothetical protein
MNWVLLIWLSAVPPQPAVVVWQEFGSEQACRAVQEELRLAHEFAEGSQLLVRCYRKG